jgi:hypothetical protein
MRHYLNDKPVPRLLTSLLVYQVAVSDLRPVPGSCSGGSGAPGYTNVVATVTDHTAWAIPLRRYAVSCGGAIISRGRPTYRSPPAVSRASERPRSAAPPPAPPPPSG